ncbi:unnamed protein product [Sphagnum troendelagicum]
MFLLFPGLVLSRGMCTELFQFHISPVASTPSNQTSDSDTPLRMLQTQWLQKLHEEALIRTCLLKLHQQGEVENQSGMVVSVLAGPQEFAGTSRRKGGKGFYMEICYQENAYQCPYLHCKIA